MNLALKTTRSFAPLAGQGRALIGQCLAWLSPHAASLLQALGGSKPQDHFDRRTGLYNYAGLMVAADRLLSHARAEGRLLSVLVIEFKDLREVRDIYGSAISGKLIAKLVRKLKALAGAHGLAGRTGPSQFTIVLPMRREKPLQALHRVLGNPARIEFDAGESEIVLVPELVLDCTDESYEGVAPLWREMCIELERVQKQEQLRQKYLQRARERHSHPMSLPSHH